MGLIRCPDCGEEVSEKAAFCRNCGLPNPGTHVPPPPPPPKKKRIKTDLLLQALGGVLLLAGIAGIVSDHTAYAFPALAGGLFLTVLGSVWGWVTKE